MIFTGHLVHERSDNSCKGWQYGRIAWSSRCQQHMELALRRWSGSEPILDVFGRWTSNMLYHFCHISKPLKQICTSTIPNMVTVICMIPSKNNPKKWCIPKFVRQKNQLGLPSHGADGGSYELRFRYADRYSEIRTAGQRQLRLTVNGAPWVKFRWRLGGGKGSRCVFWPRHWANFCGLFNVFYEYFWYMWSHILCLIHDLVRI